MCPKVECTKALKTALTINIINGDTSW